MSQPSLSSVPLLFLPVLIGQCLSRVITASSTLISLFRYHPVITTGWNVGKMIMFLEKQTHLNPTWFLTSAHLANHCVASVWLSDCADKVSDSDSYYPHEKVVGCHWTVCPRPLINFGPTTRLMRSLCEAMLIQLKSRNVQNIKLFYHSSDTSALHPAVNFYLSQLSY